MAKLILDDALWATLEPMLPPLKPRRIQFPGRKPIDHRRALTGILFVLRTDIPWELLPQEMGCGSGMTCWRRLREWQRTGVWQRLYAALSAHFNGAKDIDWSRAMVGASTKSTTLGEDDCDIAVLPHTVAGASIDPDDLAEPLPLIESLILPLVEFPAQA